MPASVSVALTLQHRLAHRAVTLDEYRDAEPDLKRPVCWPPKGRRSQQSPKAPAEPLRAA